MIIILHQQLAFLFIMLGNIIYKGHSAFVQTKIQLEVFFDRSVIDPSGKGHEDHQIANYGGLVKTSPRKKFEVRKRRDKRMLYGLVSGGAAFELYQMVQADPSLIGQTKAVWISAAADIDVLQKGGIDTTLLENQRRVKDKELRWVESLKTTDAIPNVNA